MPRGTMKQHVIIDQNTVENGPYSLALSTAISSGLLPYQTVRCYANVK